jgi:type I restriction enzyme, R subunit
LREAIKNASGEKLDLKDYEADMRHLIDNYIQADEPRTVSEFESMSLLEIIVKAGFEKAMETLPASIRNNKEAMAETIENNVRTKIVKERLTDPVFFDKMSLLLSEVIKLRKTKAIEYEEYLKRIAELAKQAQEGKASDLPKELDTKGKAALYNHFAGDINTALMVHETVVQYAPNGWKGDQSKELTIKTEIYNRLGNFDETLKVFEIIKNQGEYLK